MYLGKEALLGAFLGSLFWDPPPYFSKHWGSWSGLGYIEGPGALLPSQPPCRPLASAPACPGDGGGVQQGQVWVQVLSTWLRDASLLEGDRLEAGLSLRLLWTLPIGKLVALTWPLGVRDRGPKGQACQVSLAAKDPSMHDASLPVVMLWRDRSLPREGPSEKRPGQCG